MSKSDFAQSFIIKAEELNVDIKTVKKILSSNDENNSQVLMEWINEVKDNPKTNSELLLWTATKLKTMMEIKTPMLECKPPLARGELTFQQVKGVEKEKEQLKVNYIYPFQYPMLFPSLPKGILLYGSPGTGKTLLVRAATAELPNVAFFAPLPSELKGKYEGDTEKNIGMVFKCANAILKSSEDRYSASVIFFDEMDSIAGKRGEDPGMVRSVNSLLQSMDGIVQLPNVSVIGATNYPWNLDDAILRRFTSRIMIDLPTFDARLQIIQDGIAKGYSDLWYNLLGKLGYSREGVKTKRSYLTAMEYIKEHGSHTEFIQGGILSRGTSIDVYLKDEDLITISNKMGPSDDGEAMRDEILNKRRSVSSDDPRLDKRGVFGYSSSDVDKVIQIAIQKASERSLNGTATNKVIDGHCFWIYDPSGKGSDNIKDMLTSGNTWVFNKDEVLSCKMTKKGSDSKLISLNNLVISFDIRVTDFEQAMLEYPSTINNRDYVKVLSYSVGGVTE